MLFNLDPEGKAKPVLGVDDLLLGLTYHWCRDLSIFPTEDDRLDLATIMLFQAYTACRPAELVDGTKTRGDKDPLLDDPDDKYLDAQMIDVSLEDAEEIKRTAYKESYHHDELMDESDSDSVVDEALFDDDDGYDSAATSDIDYSDDSDDEILADVGKQDGDTAEEGEPERKHKALCYEDIVLWIVKSPRGGRDSLVMEVFFRHHKGANRKPKP